MSIDSLTYAEDYYYERDTAYRQSVREYLVSLGKRIVRPRQLMGEMFSSMDGFLNMTGKLSHRRRYSE